LSVLHPGQFDLYRVGIAYEEGKLFSLMNYPAASCGVSSSVLARYSVLDTPAPYLIRGNPVGSSGYRLPPVWRTRGKPRGM